MKVFWALVGLITLAAIVLLTTELKGTSQPEARGVDPAGPTSPRPVVAVPDVKPEVAPTPQPEAAKPVPPAVVHRDAESPAVEPLAAPEEPKPAPAPAVVSSTEPSPAEAPVAIEPKPEPVPIVATAPESTESENLLLKLKQEIEAERAAAEARRAAQAEPKPEAVAETAPAPAASSGLFGDAAVEQKPDGTLVVEGKYLVSGKGTQDSPFVITWDHLISAERDYAPKDGKKTIPARIKALDDAWIEITGYIAFPLVSDETDECLAMMNQWDGCCIGIPPTPYDAIEVRLSTTVSGDTRLTSYGSIKGRFKVDPHLVGGWLVGLYVIDQGKLSPKAFGGVAP